MDSICRLCKENKELKQSHIIPSFIGRWLKETSITGFIRQSKNPNVRKQDLIKMDLLCDKCEVLFSKYENYFAKTIFYPYVQEELNEAGIAQGNIKTINYHEYLLRFIVSLQWRVLVSDRKLTKTDNLSEEKISEYNTKIDEVLIKWQQYLNGESEITGDERHYIVFLQNLISGTGYIPENLNKNVNFYLLRAVDYTLGVSNKRIFIYTKLGPLVILSSLIPNQFSKMNDCLLRKKSVLKTAQNLQNSILNEFVFITRPNEVMPLMKYSSKQKQKISNDFTSKISTAKSLQVAYAIHSDKVMKKRMKSKL